MRPAPAKPGRAAVRADHDIGRALSAAGHPDGVLPRSMPKRNETGCSVSRLDTAASRSGHSTSNAARRWRSRWPQAGLGLVDEEADRTRSRRRRQQCPARPVRADRHAVAPVSSVGLDPARVGSAAICRCRPRPDAGRGLPGRARHWLWRAGPHLEGETKMAKRLPGSSCWRHWRWPPTWRSGRCRCAR